MTENNNQEATAAEQLIPENQPSELEKNLIDLTQKNSELNDKLLRMAAELDNTRKRNREEIEKTSKYAISNFAGDLVLAIENFYLANDNMPKEEIDKNPAIKHFADAVLMTQKELVKILEKNNIKRIYPLGEKFDHNFHEAISQVPAAEGEEENTIKQVIQAGYTIGDRLMRPALVAVLVKN